MNKNIKYFAIIFFVVIVIIFIFSFTKKAMGPEIQILNNKSASVNISKDTAKEKEKEPIKLIFVGDIMLSRSIGKLMLENNDWNFPFLKIGDFLKNADLTIGNLESPISNNGIKVGSIYSFRADPRVIEGLKNSGFDILSFANNHVWDYGSEAFSDTLNILKQNSLDSVGAGFTYEESHKPLIKEIRGARIAFLSYTNLLSSSLGLKDAKYSVAFPDREQIKLDIEKAKSQADIVVVAFHWGEEYKTFHNLSQESLAHFVIDSGADLVIGHHPHVAQDLEKYKEGYIAYSLGNFVFDQNFSDDTKSGLVLTAIIKDKKISEIITNKVKFTEKYQPFLVND
ncbi:MAG: CapA family protein [bacterium]|nr:CapA family protein [bacterium]